MIEQAILEYAANSIWQIPMLAGMAWLVLRLCRPSARAQHRLWLTTLALAVILPLRGMGANAMQTRPPAQSEVVHAVQSIPMVASHESTGSHALLALHGEEHATRPLNILRLPMRTIRLSKQTAYWLVGLYLLAILFRLVQLAYAWRAARSLMAGAKKTVLPQPLLALLQRCCEKFDVPEPQVRMSSAMLSPVTMGVVRPMLVLPETFSESTESEMTAVLCHELAHVRRRDYRMNLLCQIGALPIVYHPATHAMQRRVRQTREMVCDALAADAMQSASGYARCLVGLAQRMLEGRGVAEQVQAVGLFDNNVLEERVMRLLETKTTMSVRASVARVAAGAVLMTAVTAMAAIFHVTPMVVQAAQANVPAIPAAPPPPVAVQVAPVPAPAARPTPAVLPAPVALPAPAPQPVPTSQPAPAPPVAPRRNGQIHPQPKGPLHGFVIQDGQYRDLTPEERARLQKELATATAQVQEETRRLQSQEFKKQMQDMQQQIAEAAKKMQSAEVQRQLKMLQSPEFKQQMADMQKQAAEAAKNFQSVEVQRQLKMLQSPEFKQQMADMQKQAAEAAKNFQSAEVQRQLKMLQSPEFKQQMQDMQQQIDRMAKRLESDEAQRQKAQDKQP